MILEALIYFRCRFFFYLFYWGESYAFEIWFDFLYYDRRKFGAL